MHANVEDRGIKGDITPLMAAASGGYVDIVKLLLVHGADVNAQSSTGINTYKRYSYAYIAVFVHGCRYSLQVTPGLHILAPGVIIRGNDT